MWASGLLREQAGTSWALRPRELGQAVFWAGSGEKEREEEADRAGLGSGPRGRER